MLKVVFVGHRDLYFGAESVLFRVMMIVKNKGIALPLLVLPISAAAGFRSQFKDPPNKNHQPQDIKRVHFKLLNGSLIRSIVCLIYQLPALVRLYIYYRKQQVDVIYTNTIVNTIGPLLALMLNKRHIWHLHEQPTPGKFKWLPRGLFPFYRFLLRQPQNTIIFVSRQQQSLWQNEFGCTFPNSKVIYTPPERIQTVPQDLIEQHDDLQERASAAASGEQTIPSTINYGFLGSFTASKNLDSLLRCFAQLQSNYPDQKCQLFLMGEGEMEANLKIQIKHLGLQNSVTLLPYSRQTNSFFTAITIFVLPSWFESWGLVALEAIAQQKNLILTQNTALTEVLDQRDCRFIDPEQEVTLYAAMERLLIDPVLRSKLAKHAFQTLQRLNLAADFELAITTLFIK
ncbi:glycosyltransferase family 4 protein [Pedobacter sp.]|uniref:glycosyltransferase family 4 protein n=1 Tax=Pedobacter sp. TaxID=1411316 RepID=UPI003D7FB13E